MNVYISNKNSSIEFFRFLFMAILIAWHGGFKFFAHGYLVVEFFFILSGFFLYISFIKKNKGTLQYTEDKIKRTYIEYFLACMFMFFLVVLQALVNNRNVFTPENLFKLISEILLLQNIGIFNGGFNTPLWYFSVLIWGGGILYSLLKYNRHLMVNVLLPLYVLFFYTYIFNKQDSIECWEREVFYIPMLRGLADMSVGIIWGKFSFYALSKISNGGGKIKIFNAVSLISLALLLFAFYNKTTFDKYCLVFIPLILLNCICKEGILNRIFSGSISQSLGGITYEMYLLHAPLLMILNKTFDDSSLNNFLRFIIYILIIMVCGKCLKVIGSRLNNKLFL